MLGVDFERDDSDVRREGLVRFLRGRVAEQVLILADPYVNDDVCSCDKARPTYRGMLIADEAYGHYVAIEIA